MPFGIRILIDGDFYYMKDKLFSSFEYVKTFIKWMVVSVLIGVVGGSVGSLFHKCIDLATETRVAHSRLLFLLPFGGIVICALYSLTKTRVDTNRVIESVRGDQNVPWYMAPLIFVSTVITHLLGGSAGREGAALQLGGSIGYNLGKLLRLKEGDLHIIVMAGMSAVFAALFGTPLTAMFFALEVTSVGIMYYAGLLPCAIAALTAASIAAFFGLSPVRFDFVSFPELSVGFAVKTVILAILCALVCIVFCTALQKCEHYSEKLVKNKYLRTLVGSLIIVVLTLALGTRDYNGAGMDVIARALAGDARIWDFAVKIIFTAITIASGFKGGEIVPAFFIGSTFGCVMASVLGVPAGCGAAIGFVALFCGVVNCPVASVLLALEVFGVANVPVFAIVCGVTYMMSGYCGLYKSQKIMYSKLEAKYVNTNAG